MRTLHRYRWTWIVLGWLASASALGAQSDATGPGSGPGFCFHDRPQPECSGFLVTSTGTYLSQYSPAIQPIGIVINGGVMFNRGPRSALGGTASVNAVTGSAGLAFRYRRWVGRRSALDMELGASVGGRTSYVVHALVIWSPTSWMGVGVRPELVRTGYTFCESINGGPSSCQDHFAWHARLSVGVELREVPGLLTSALAGLVALDPKIGDGLQW